MRATIRAMVVAFLLMGSGCASGRAASKDLVSLEGISDAACLSHEDGCERERSTKQSEYLGKIVSDVPVPMKTPDRVIRVLILPWVDEQNRLHSYSYAYVRVEKGEWVLGDYLMSEELNRKVIRPLEQAEPMGQSLEGAKDEH